jgi:alpha-ketoglutarate-dependent taurine dioxygenase
MISSEQLRKDGYLTIAGISSESELMSIAKLIGRPLPSPTGEFVKEMMPKSRADARLGTASAIYGTSSFPLHTDTAFWPLPSRYLVMRVYGDCRRATTVLRFEDAFRKGSADLVTRVERSIWRIGTPSASHYCSMRFRHGEQLGWRYDELCMAPVNEAARLTQAELPQALARCEVQKIEWSGDLALILDNWQVLHGRAVAPPDEKVRILQRIYVG